MSLDPSPIEPVPEETARVARAIFPKGNRYLLLRDTLGTLFTDTLFVDLFPTRGQPALAPWRLALVTLIQYIEGLPDRQAAEAVRTRIDLKYVLGLSLTDPGFDFSVLSEFRARLLAHSAAERLLDVLLEACQKNGWLAGGGRQRTDSTHVLARVRRLNRIDLVGETLRAALNALAVAAPDWLQEHSLPDWWERYALPFDVTRLAKSEAQRETVALTVGQDGLALLAALEAEPQVVWLREIPAMQTLQQVWQEHYQVREGTLLWRPRDDLPPASALIASPYDVEARYALKRSTEWVGYKVHLTETCDAGRPHLITQVTTMPAPSADSAVTTPIQQALERKGLLPGQQIVDTGYVDAGELLRSQSRGVVLLGPVPPNTAATPAAFALEQFTLQWDQQQAICPAGKASVSWLPLEDRHGNPILKVTFRTSDCRACPHHGACTRGAHRTLTVRPQAEWQALQEARKRQATEEFKQQYAIRAGIEGTLSQGTRAFGLRRCRYRGAQKAHLQQVVTACAINLVRITAWIQGDLPVASRPAPFARLRDQAA
jgi:transposase